MNMLKKDNVMLNFIAFILFISVFSLYYKPSFTVALIMFLMFLCYKFYKKETLSFLIFPLDFMKGIILFLGCILLASLVTLDKENINKAVEIIYSSLPFFCVYVLKTYGDIRPGIKAGLIAVAIAGFFLSIYEYYVLDIPRVGSLLKSVNLWSSALGLILPLSCYFFYAEKSAKLKILWLLCTFMLLYSIYLTKTRGMLVALLLVVFVLGMQKFTKIIVSLILAVMIYLAFNPEQLLFFHRAYDIERLYGYQASIKMWMDNPVIGVGLSKWAEQYKTVYFPQGAKEILVHAHNIFLFFLSAAGSLGIISFLYFMYNSLKYLYKKQKINIFYVFGFYTIVIFMLHGLFDAVFIYKAVARIFWLILAVYTAGVFVCDSGSKNGEGIKL